MNSTHAPERTVRRSALEIPPIPPTQPAPYIDAFLSLSSWMGRKDIPCRVTLPSGTCEDPSVGFGLGFRQLEILQLKIRSHPDQLLSDVFAGSWSIPSSSLITTLRRSATTM